MVENEKTLIPTTGTRKFAICDKTSSIFSALRKWCNNESTTLTWIFFPSSAIKMKQFYTVVKSKKALRVLLNIRGDTSATDQDCRHFIYNQQRGVETFARRCFLKFCMWRSSNWTNMSLLLSTIFQDWLVLGPVHTYPDILEELVRSRRKNS